MFSIQLSIKASPLYSFQLNLEECALHYRMLCGDRRLHMARIHAQHMEDDLECVERKMWWKHDPTQAHIHTYRHLIISRV